MSTVRDRIPTASPRAAAGDARGRRRATGRVARPGQGPGLLRKTRTVLTTALLVLACAAFLLLAVGPRLLGYQTSTMLTGSMSPLINPGDVVVTVPTPLSEIRVGDIITYHIPVEDQRVETHRVMSITTNPDGSTSAQTKGDANNGADPWQATFEGTTVDRHVATIPYVGQAIRFLRQPLIQNSLMYGAPSLLVLGMLATIWGKPKEQKATADAEADHAATLS